jgi:predicted phage terminase large subunit-like protein
MAKKPKPPVIRNRLDALMTLAVGEDSPRSFAAFYELVFGVKPPPFVLEEWIKPLYEARKDGKGIVIEAFRGSTKTTTLTIAFTAYRIGKEPHRANLLIQVGDDTAVDTTQQIADIIENNPGFRVVFPRVVPDRERGWGAGGYEVKREGIPYQTWRDLNAKRRDPTLLGVSYKSRAIIGRHPDGVLVVDDIHDENNTVSERELATVRRILTGTIFPTLTPDTWKIFVGTPWVENDALQYVASTGEFDHAKTPVYREDGNYTWPEKFDEKEVEIQKNLAGSIEFARMFLLDLTASKNKFFKYQVFPNSNLRFNWPIVGGVDYAGTRDNLLQKKTGDRDYFAIAYVAKLPGGGAVVVDGVLEKCSQAEAEGYVMRGQEMYPNYLNSVVEGDGTGDLFIQTIMRNPNMKIIPMKTKGKGKQIRFTSMQPWLESGQVRISDAETPFLRELRKELNTYPLSKYVDALDALYWALMGVRDVLSTPREEFKLPAYEKKEQVNPFAELSNWR